MPSSRMSATRMRGLSELNGSWNTICACRRRVAALRAATVSPASTMLPAVGSISRSSALPTVVLPQPDSPTSASVRPGWIDSVTSSTARTWPTVRWIKPRLIGKCTFRPSTCSKACATWVECVGGVTARALRSGSAPARWQRTR